MDDAAVSQARKALNRLRRAAGKALREMEALEASLVHAEGSDFPVDRYARVRRQLDDTVSFVEEEAARLQEKVLHTGGLEPGRVRRSS